MEWLKRIVLALLNALASLFKKQDPQLPPPPKEPEEPKPRAELKPRYLHLSRSGGMAYGGLEGLILKLMEQDGKELDRIIVVSGQPKHQEFRLAKDSQSGSHEPPPQGKYDLGPIEFASGRYGDYSKNYPTPGIGPVWVDVKPTMSTARSALGFHLDSNRSGSPGSDGCIALPDLDSLKKFCLWFAPGMPAPKTLFVDWNLTDVSLPKDPTDGRKSVLIEVGHGPFLDEATGKEGWEPGAMGPVSEYVVNKTAADHAKLALTRLGYRVDILDKAKTLVELGQEAEGYDVFVSIHANSFDKMVQGSEVLVHTHATEADKRLASLILKEIVATLKLRDRGVKPQKLAVLSKVPMSVKGAVLTEAFFIDSVKDKATALAYAQRSGVAIALGIDKFLKS